MKKILYNGDFRSICIGAFISTIGDNLYNIALTIGLYNISGEVSSVAFMWLIRAIMRVPVQFFSGVIADKFNRKYLIVLMNLLSVPIAFLFIFSINQSIYLLYLLVFLLQATNDIEAAASVGILPEVVSKDKLAEANSVFSIISTSSLFLSPAIAGILYKLYGINILFIINSLTFLIASIFYSLIKYNYVHGEKKEQKFMLFKFAYEGYMKITNNKIVLSIFICSMCTAILGRYFDIYKVYIADHLLNIGAEGIIYFSYSMALGGLITPVVVKVFIGTKKLSANLYSWVSFVLALLLLIWANITNAISSISILIFVGTLFSLLDVILNTTLQHNIEKEYLGRVFSFYKILIILSAIIGAVSAPILLKYFNIAIPFVFVVVINAIFVTVVNALEKQGREKNLIKREMIYEIDETIKEE
jgi:MFS family permease